MANWASLSKRSQLQAFTLATALLALTSCSKLRLGYEYADWLVIYSVEDNFDLDKGQRNQLKENVADYFKWHRKQMLPAYSTFLYWIAAQTRNGLKAQQIDSGFARYEALRLQTLEPIIGKAMNFMGSLTPEQINYWEERQRKKAVKSRKDFSGGLDERLEHRLVKIIDELEDWTGKLSPDQKMKIKVLNQTLPWNGNLWLESHEKANERLALLLRNPGPKERLKLFLQDYYLNSDNLRSKEYQNKYKEFLSRSRTLVLVIQNILTVEQKQRLISQLEKLALDFHNLSLQE